jgi:hypothetical protein
VSTDLNAVYLKAAEVIRINGHYKGAYYEPSPESGVGILPAPSECRVCAGGALSIAMFGHPIPPSAGSDREEFDAITDMILDRIDAGGSWADSPVTRLAGWNDADDRTPADVIAVFERTAREVAA